jgi:hypothetical protein
MCCVFVHLCVHVRVCVCMCEHLSVSQARMGFAWARPEQVEMSSMH